MNHSLYLSAVIVAAGLAACDKPAVVAVPSPSPAVVAVPAPSPAIVVPGPAGPAGPSGEKGAMGATGRPGDTAVIVVPPASAPN